MKPISGLRVLGVFVLLSGGLALADSLKPGPINDPTNEPPPAGAIQDLNGTPIPGGGDGTTFQPYTVNFVASQASTAITFAFRDDPAFISFENASVVNQTTSSSNLLANGNFAGGTYTDNGNTLTPVGWTYSNPSDASNGGQVFTDCGGPSSTCWSDGAVQAYDSITQSIATTPGDSYQISYDVAESSGCGTNGGPPCNFSTVSTNGDISDTGGNGIDVLAYAQPGAAGPPAPEQNFVSTINPDLTLDNGFTANCFGGSECDPGVGINKGGHSTTITGPFTFFANAAGDIVNSDGVVGDDLINGTGASINGLLFETPLDPTQLAQGYSCDVTDPNSAFGQCGFRLDPENPNMLQILFDDAGIPNGTDFVINGTGWVLPAPASTPEPGSWALLLTVVAGLIVRQKMAARPRS